ncbi:Macrolide export ATP-binding/permease protein MacB [hydrothermal vent metagenome]|uniref:Macrolide export ATP-binding/permease protein MacB n=1 Tax=hydrothermal vent metagenome TaxID=652676 RepID=A0A3B0TJ95_9ZZZZ
MSLAVRDVTHTYRTNAGPVLHDVSLELGDGETVAIMGPSGSGKTTLLSILGLLMPPTSGDVLLDGERIPGGRVRRGLQSRDFAWVSQTTNVLARRSVRDNAALALLGQGAQRTTAYVEAEKSLVMVGLAGLSHRTVQTLSGGELQRVCIARALCGRPRFILADEPSGQLDSATTSRVLDALLAAREQGSSLIVATHDPEVAERMDRVIELRDGELSVM